jgi:5-methylthioadenosine/S-adenosylhomocysteine deaminase
MKKQKTLFSNATIITMDNKIGNFSKGQVLIENGKIREVTNLIDTDDADIIDASGMILMPGLVDAHRHAWQGTLRRLMPDANNLMAYVKDIHLGLARFYRPEDIYLGNLITALSAVDNGITTIVDASHNTRSYEHASAAISALEQSGIRSLYAPGFPLGGDWDNKFWPEGLRRLKHERLGSNGLIKLGVFTHMGVHSWDIARELELPIVTEFLGKELSGLLKDLEAKKLLGPDNIFNHCTGLTEEAWNIIGDTGVNVTLDARSDAQYGLEEGIYPYQRAIEQGIKPALGTDLETSYGGDMFTEMRVAFALQRAFAQNRRFNGDDQAPAPVSSRAILEAATINGAEVAGFGNVTGSITPGKSADLILIDTRSLNLFPSNNALGTIVHAADRGNVHTVMIAGKILKSEGKLIGFDIAKIKNEIEDSLAYLFDKAGYEADMLEEEFPGIK